MQTPITDSPAGKGVLKEREAAAFLSLSRSHLQGLHKTGEGPKRTRLSSRRIGYRLVDLEAWLDARREVA